jgi:poly-gamma-glutamate biosynthesis protein PgsC/CapC
MPFETVFVGVVVALLYAELTGILPGGIIVPAFLALSLDRPARALATVGIACLCVLVFRRASRYFILFGRRRFVVMVLLGGLGAQALWLAAPQLFPLATPLRALGLVIPGLMANNLERQEFLPTIASLTTVTVVTYFLGNLLKLAGL